MSGPASGIIPAARPPRRRPASRTSSPTTWAAPRPTWGLIQDGVPQVSAELELEYAMPIHVPMVDVHTIGAGGGSVASIGDDGLLHVGPRSAGALPGPICYGRGGSRPISPTPTCCSAASNPEKLLGVEARDLAGHPAHIDERIGRALGLDAAAAPRGDCAHRQRPHGGRDPHGVAGARPRSARFRAVRFRQRRPLHAAALARELGIPRLLVPMRGDHQRARLRRRRPAATCEPQSSKPLPALDESLVPATLEAQIAEGRATLEREGVRIEGVKLLHFADMQFQGQSHILTVALPGTRISRDDLQRLFDKAYWDRFEVELPGSAQCSLMSIPL